ncbi:MAG: hypothetical protein M1608_06795 [Candidatus Omnitrophica bacterium]|nr:hypothetical protein [Candidatus Omnitrophota bacterium]
MIAVSLDIRRLRIWTNSLVRAFALSLLFHVVLFSTMELGHQLGWWKPRGIPHWMAEALRRQANKQALETKSKANLKNKDNTQQNQPEVPLVFVEVDPSQAVTDVPKAAKYYSSRNSVAANPEVRVESDVPNITGNQNHLARTTSTPRPKALPLQPLPGAMESQETMPELKPMTAKIEPAPKIIESKPEPKVVENKPEPKPAETQPQAQAKVEPGDLTFAKPQTEIAAAAQPSTESAPALVAPPPARSRPRTLAAARQQRGLLAGEKMLQEGGVKRRGLEASLDVKATPFGAYDAAIVAAIQQRWYDLLDENDYVRGRTGKVVLEFRLTYEGRITDVHVAENSVGELLSLICQRAVLDPAPYGRWPSDMRRMVGSDYREVRFTFYYD